MLEVIAQPPSLNTAKKAKKTMEHQQKNKKHQQKETKLLMATVATTGLMANMELVRERQACQAKNKRHRTAR